MADQETGRRKEILPIAGGLRRDSAALLPTVRMRAVKRHAPQIQTGRHGQVREIAGQPKAETRARMLRLLTAATGHRLRHQMAGAASRMADTRTGTARINRPHGRMRLVTRTRRPTTTPEAAARI